MQENRIELLAPAGSREALEAVCEAGADAVYFSEKRFSMRQHGAWLNFTHEELGDVIDYAHGRGVKAYLTLNNLLTGQELKVLEESLLELAALKPDAFIIQDLGLLRILNRLDIDIPLHASTMMNIHHALGADLLKRHKVSRIITSRDIDLEAAREIGRRTGVEIEYFVHGDMCIAVGSQCLHSGVATDMSANRGKCLKSCRWAWDLVDRENDKILGKVEEQYLLAMKDISLYHQLPHLISMGIHSLKIEGRARPGDYLRPIVTEYRQAIDRYYADPAAYATDFEGMRRLRSATLREIGTSHAFSQPGKEAVGLSGKREPRIFSIAVEEAPWSPEPLDGAETIMDRDGGRPELSVRCGTMDAARALLDSRCDWLYVGGERFSGQNGNGWPLQEMRALIREGREKGKRIGMITPRITGDRESAEITQLVDGLEADQPDSYLAANIGSLELLRGLTDTPIHGDYFLNPWNGAAVDFLQGEGVGSFAAGAELSLPLVKDLADEATLPMESLVHGSLPGMLLEYCPIGTHMTGTTRNDPCPGPCTQRNYALRSRIGQKHWLLADQYCRNHLFMAKDLCMIAHLDSLRHRNIRRLRIEGTLYEPAYLQRLVALYAEAIDNLMEGRGDAGLIQRVLADAPRELTLGAYGVSAQAISEPCQTLPTDMVIQFDTELPGQKRKRIA